MVFTEAEEGLFPVFELADDGLAEPEVLGEEDATFASFEIDEEEGGLARGAVDAGFVDEPEVLSPVPSAFYKNYHLKL